jgi:hypothetical protein
MMNFPIADLIEEIEDRMTEIVGNLTCVSADKIGLDYRAGRVYVSHEGIIVDGGSRRTLEYYGGFEYVDRDYVKEIGGFTFYSRDDDRVEDAVSYYMHGDDDSDGKEILRDASERDAG